MDFGQGLGRYRLAERSKLAKLRGENSGPTDLHRSQAATTLPDMERIVPGMAWWGEVYDNGSAWAWSVSQEGPQTPSLPK